MFDSSRLTKMDIRYINEYMDNSVCKLCKYASGLPNMDIRKQGIRSLSYKILWLYILLTQQRTITRFNIYSHVLLEKR